MLRAFRDSDGTEVRPGDTVLTFRGEEVTFAAATRAPDRSRAGKIIIQTGVYTAEDAARHAWTREGEPIRGEFWMGVCNLTVREVPDDEPALDPDEAMRQTWNEAVAAHAAAPTGETAARVEKLKTEYLTAISMRIIAEDTALADARTRYSAGLDREPRP